MRDSLVDMRKENNGIWGNWTVLDVQHQIHTSPSGQRKALWLCQCSCGVQQWVSGASLRNGNSTGCYSCGRKRGAKATLIDMRKQTLPDKCNWIVNPDQEPKICVNENGSRATMWWCKCAVHDVEKWVGAGNLRNGASLGCHLCRGYRVGESKKLRPFESAYNTLKTREWWRTETGGLTYEEFLGFTEVEECHYCGIELIWHPYRSKRNNHNGVSNLDRKDSFQGYNKENAVVCCFSCNEQKSNKFTYEEFLIVGEIKRLIREQGLEAAKTLLEKTNVKPY